MTAATQKKFDRARQLHRQALRLERLASKQREQAECLWFDACTTWRHELEAAGALKPARTPAPKLPAPEVTHMYVEKGIGFGRTNKRAPKGAQAAA